MSLASEILSRTRTPTLTVYLDGRRWIGVQSINLSQEFGQGISGGTVVGRQPPTTPRTGMPIRWSWGYGGFTVAGFSGYVVTPEISSYPNTWSLEVQDALWPAQRENGPIQTSPLNNITAQDAIIYILETYAGITRVNIPTIGKPSDTGTSWELGTQTPVSWSSTTALAACQEIAATAGYWLYADASGTVRARQMERRPSDSPFRTLEKGDAAGATLLVEGAPRRRQDGNQVKNRWTVRGANTGVEGAQVYDVFSAPHVLTPGTISEGEYSTFLLEDVNDCTAVAARLTALWNRRPNTVTARIKADPRLAVGTTVAIKDEKIGYSSGQPFFIYRISTTYEAQTGGFSQEIVLDGGVGDAGYSEIPPPVAVLTVDLEKETLDGTASTLVMLDGSGSYSQSGGEIVSWQFSTASTVVTGTPTGSSSPHSQDHFTLIFPDTSSPVTMSLTVTDTSLKTGTVEVAVDLAGDGTTVPTTETINVAFGAAQQATPDGGATWYSDAQTTTRVPPVGAGVDSRASSVDAGLYGILAAGDQEVRQSLDVLQTAATVLNTASGAITALSVNVANGARVWRAVGALVQRSTDGGVSWTNWGTPLPGTDVLDIIEDPAVDNSVFCVAGADFYHSTSSPGSWSVFYAGPTGAVARWIQRSISGDITWICYTGTFTGSPLQRVEGGISVTFPVLSPTVDEIRAIALTDPVSPASPQIIAIDQEARIFVIDALTGLSPTQSAEAFPAGTIVQHAQHSYQAPLVYAAVFDSVAAGTGAIYKYLYQSDALLLFFEGATGQQAHMVGIGSSGQVVRATILLVTRGVSPGGVYVYRDGVWTLSNSGLPTNWHWSRVYVNPFNVNDWILCGQVDSSASSETGTANKVVSEGTSLSPFWRTTDGGTTWAEYVVTADQAYTAPTLFQISDLFAMFDSQGNPVVTAEMAIGGTDSFWLIWRSGSYVTRVDIGGLQSSITPGRGGDLVLGYEGDVSPGVTEERRGYIPGGGASVTFFSTAPERYALYRRNGQADTIAYGHVVGTGTDVLRWADYTASGSPTTIASLGSAILSLAVAGDGVYALTAAGVYRISNPDGTPSTALVFDATSNDLVSSAQGGSRFLVAGQEQLGFYDGTTWNRIAAPSGLTGGQIGGLAVIDTGGT